MPEASPPTDRLARRRASLIAALRDGDVRRAARAWSRLRVDGAALGTTESTAGRAARAEIGRALRLARERRAVTGALAPRTDPAPIALPAAAPSWIRPATLALLCAGLALALLPLVPVVAPAHRYTLPSPLPTALALVASRGGGRGRTEETLPPVALAAARAPVAPSVAAIASAAPSASPSVAPTASPQPSPSPSPSVAPVTAPTRLPAASTPPPGVTPGPVAPGYSRLIVLVVDETTLEPIAGACIVIGVPDCSPSRPHTNSAGLWWLDFPTGQMAGTQWPVQIVKDGYATLSAVVTTTGAGQQFVAPLQPLQ